jgi:hypothetical protein
VNENTSSVRISLVWSDSLVPADGEDGGTLIREGREKYFTDKNKSNYYPPLGPMSMCAHWCICPSYTNIYREKNIIYNKKCSR